jgi:L-2,4-diaminobutyric acid acetyltransferase
MVKTKSYLNFKIRNVSIEDIKEVYSLLKANRPYVGLNSRYTYFLLAKDFADTCVVAEHEGKIVAFSSGYVSPTKRDTFFSWEAVVHRDYRGNKLQKRMLLWQIMITGVRYFEGTVNPSNEASKMSFLSLAQLLKTRCEESLLFSEDDFENDCHEPEILYRVGPISQEQLAKNMQLSGTSNQTFERAMFMHVESRRGTLKQFEELAQTP